MSKVVVNAPEARGKFEQWLARGEAIGVFENVDLGHYMMGHTVFLPLDAEDQARVEVGKTQAPDGPYGLGWRYRLNLVARSLDEFDFQPEVETPDPECRCGATLNIDQDYNDEADEWEAECRACRLGLDEDEDEDDEPVFTPEDALNAMNRLELLLDHPERIVYEHEEDDDEH
jgi:hypothetical protein